MGERKAGDSAVEAFRVVVAGLIMLFLGYVFVGAACEILGVFEVNNTTQTEDYYFNSTTSTIDYFNMTVVDKYIDKDLVYDDYYVICRDMNNSEISKVDDMQLYYNVEVGKSYNISVEVTGLAMIREVIEEI